MRDSAARILRALGEAPDGLTMRELVEATRLHENALRRRIASLRAAGSVHVTRDRAESRGRPALRYRRTASADEAVARFVPLLLGVLDRSRVPTGAAFAVGRDHASAHAGRRTPVDAVVGSLAAHGFAPREEARGRAAETVISLTRCPFTEAVTSSRSGREVCALHHGLIMGVAEAAGGELSSFIVRDPRVAPCEVRLPRQDDDASEVT